MNVQTGAPTLSGNSLSDMIGNLAKYRPWADPLLREENDKAADKSPQKLHASLALLPTLPMFLR